MKRKLKSYSHALVLQSMWDVADYSDQTAIKQAKAAHNAAALRLMKAFEGENMDCFLVGVSGCTICNPCALVKGQPCAFPKKQWSCMSAYCVFVRELADLCGLEYDCGDGLLAFFGMIVFRDQEIGA